MKRKLVTQFPATYRKRTDIFVWVLLMQICFVFAQFLFFHYIKYSGQIYTILWYSDNSLTVNRGTKYLQSYHNEDNEIKTIYTENQWNEIDLLGHVRDIDKSNGVRVFYLLTTNLQLKVSIS
jgi:hypothetical protein